MNTIQSQITIPNSTQMTTPRKFHQRVWRTASYQLLVICLLLLLAVPMPTAAQSVNRAEIIVGRASNVNFRWAVHRFDPSTSSIEILGTPQGTDWGSDRITTALATGDVDGDSRDEVIVGRDAGPGMRWAIYRMDSATGEMVLLGEYATTWGPDYGVTALATGDVNGDGRDEVVVGRHADTNLRWLLYQYNPTNGLMELLGSPQGVDWSADRSTAALAMGDLDGDGRDEIVVGRDAGAGFRWAVYGFSLTTNDLELFDSLQGVDWEVERSVTDLAIGDINGDGRAEIAVGRSAGAGMRWALYHFNTATKDLELFDNEQGITWGPERGATEVEMADVNGDGRAEITVGRSAGTGHRWAVYHFNTTTNDIETLGNAQGLDWGTEAAVTALAMGDVTGDGRNDVIVGRNTVENMRWAIYQFNPAINDLELFDSPQGTSWGPGAYPYALAVGDVDPTDGRHALYLPLINK
jgi:hypothetical protein